MPQSLEDIRFELALANRMVAHEGVLDAFGHVSVRHPDDPGRYLLSRSRSPELVEPDDLVEFDLDSEPVTPQSVRSNVMTPTANTIETVVGRVNVSTATNVYLIFEAYSADGSTAIQASGSIWARRMR